MNNEKNNENNVVRVVTNTNNVNVVNTNNNGFNNSVRLNQERQNIVNASIEANGNIDEKMAKQVNEHIKLKKKNPFVSLMLLLIVSLVIILFLNYALTPLKKALHDATSTTTKTTAPVQTQDNIYTRNLKITRKFKNDDCYLILSANDVDLAENKLYYIFYDLKTKKYSYNTYEIRNDVLELNGLDKIYQIKDEYLIDGEEELQIFDSEMKVYKYYDHYISYTLIMNGTPGNEVALYIDSNTEKNQFTIGKFVETDTEIQLNKLKFTKTPTYISINGKKLIYS